MSCLGLPEPPELRAADEGMLCSTPLGSSVRVKEDFSVDSGQVLRQGEAAGHGNFGEFNRMLDLVGGLEHFLFSHILGTIIPID